MKTLERRLIDMDIDEIMYRNSVWYLQGCYTTAFTGNTIEEALNKVETMFPKKVDND